jgi:polyphosphate kinase
MRHKARAILCAALFWVPQAALAHPHVYIDTGVEFLFDDQGRVEALRITWTYDELFSLMVVEDLGVDPDYDGKVDDAARNKLNGFDMDWDPDFVGDTYVLASDAPVLLERPSDWTADYTNGKLVSTHVRRFAEPVDPVEKAVVVEAYDPGFYTAYTIVGQPVLTGRTDCAAQVFEPDLTAADEQLKQALAEYDATVDLEMEFPAIGAAYSDEIRLTCEDRS